MRINKILSLSVAALALATMAGAADVEVTLPDTGQSSTLTATVTEQATVNVPAAISFAVSDVSLSTDASATAITVSGIVLDTVTKQLKISIKAATGSFTGSGTTYSAGDVSWGTSTWTGATATPGTLTTSFQTLATCTAGVTGCDTTDALFSLAAQPVTTSGAKTLTLNYKFESIGT